MEDVIFWGIVDVTFPDAPKIEVIILDELVIQSRFIGKGSLISSTASL